MSDKDFTTGIPVTTTEPSDGDEANDLPDLGNLSIYPLLDEDKASESDVKTTSSEERKGGSDKQESPVEKDKSAQRAAESNACLTGDDVASKMPVSASDAVTGKPVEDLVPKTAPEGKTESSKLKEPTKETEISNADSDVDANDEESDIDSDAEDSDVDSNDPDAFDENIFDYDSDEGEMVEYYRPAPQEKPQGTPLERFVRSLSEVPAEELTNMDKCRVCNGAYKVLGVVEEVALRLLCGHFVGKECLGVFMGSIDEGGLGFRNCPECREKIVVPGE